jgi:bacterial/archaeal transporter family protein
VDRYAWIAVLLVTWGTANFLLKIVGTRLDHFSGVLAIVAGYVVAGTIFATAGGGRLAFTWAHATAALIGALYIIGNWAFLRLSKTEEITTLAPIGNLAVVLTILLGFVVLHEPLTVKKLVGILFAIIAVILLS